MRYLYILYFGTAPPPDNHDSHNDQESPEFQTMIACTADLSNLLAIDPITISEHLMAKGLFPRNTHSQLLHSTDIPINRARQLVEVMTTCVQADASNFDVFIAVLKEQGGWTKKILDTLIKTYSKKSK